MRHKKITLSDGQEIELGKEIPIKVPAHITSPVGILGKDFIKAMVYCNFARILKPLNQLTKEEREARRLSYDKSHDDKGRWRKPDKEELDDTYMGKGA